ncbi:MAG: hypothetical protein UW41_C0006G0038 [Candidatus Collierbacteria bacterium GW2011_GWC2_44_18]|uniref:Uncharacterized protein n=1 Tax=Candidatus Collierbacteria bacterium GW2011_GWC2_44_18 TaxID=1618392 RepID=A0A0G1HRA1_9BACT|nr:MAG: hypothetical protein UW41_C0006G0038 [Candidatus Collierbacteria bacterium GW2011_GWC2_44_18]
MTTTQTNSIQSLYEATTAFVRACLIAKLSFDSPDELSNDFNNTLKIVDAHGLEINEASLVERKYPELGKKLVELAGEIVTNEVFNDRTS